MNLNTGDQLYLLIGSKFGFSAQREARTYEYFLSNKWNRMSFQEATRSSRRNNLWGGIAILATSLFFGYAGLYAARTEQPQKALINAGLTAAFVYLGGVRLARSRYYGQLERIMDTQGVPAARQRVRQQATGSQLNF